MIKRSSPDKLALAADQNVREGRYWLQQLAGVEGKRILPRDYTPDPKNKTIPVSVTQAFPGALNEKVAKLSGGVDVKLHMVVVTGLNILMHKYSGGEDITVGSPILKQEREGEFINTYLVFRSLIQPSASFKESLLKVRETIIKANEHQNYPMDILMERLNLTLSEAEHPLFDTVVMLENFHDKSYLEGVPYGLLFSFLNRSDGVRVTVDYNAALYRESTVERILEHYFYVLEQALGDVNAPISNIDVLSSQEREQLLGRFNSTGDIEGAGQKTQTTQVTLHGLFGEQAGETPRNVAVVGFGNEGRQELTFENLNHKAETLAARLKGMGVGPDTIVGLMVDASIDMMVGILGILKAGGAYLPIDPIYPNDRIAFMLADSQAPVLVTWRELAKAHSLDVDKIYFDQLEGHGQEEKQGEKQTVRVGESDVESQANHLAYVIYTSGTTGKPKGVLVEHRNVVSYLDSFYAQFDIRETDAVLQLASFAFDVFIEEVFPVLLRGGKVVIPSVDEILDIPRLASLAQAEGVTVIDNTPLFLKEFNRLVSENGEHPLKGLRYVISGGDVLKPSYVDKLVETAILYNTYGPTESTVCATYYQWSGQYRHSGSQGQLPPGIPIGKPVKGYNVYILDDNLQPVPIGIPGQLCVSGPGVTRGYLNRPQLTAERFRTIEPGGFSAVSGSFPSSTIRLYLTGDLVRWLPDGNIEFAGRMDQQVKIRGYRIETGEIENRIKEFPGIDDAVVIAREKSGAAGEKYLAAYYVASALEGTNGDAAARPIDQNELREFLGLRLPDYMIPAYLVVLPALPLTPNGKVDVKNLPEPEADSGVPYVEPETDNQRRMQAIWRETLGIEKIGIHDNFFTIGGHSLKGVQVLNDIHKEFNVKIPLAEMFRLPTIKGLCDYIEETGVGEETFAAVPTAEKQDYYPLSPGQKRLFFLQQMEPHNTAYNMPQVLPLDGGHSREQLETAFKILIQRHESLRTSFGMIDEEPMQQVHEQVVFHLGFYQVENNEQAAAKARDFVSPFSMDRAPLLRAALLEIGSPASRAHLMLDLHHIINDAVSQEILTREFNAILTGRELPPLTLHYKDYSQWQNSKEQQEALERQEAFWLKHFDGEVPLLNLPTDYARPTMQDFSGDNTGFFLEPRITEGLNSLASREGATLYHVLLSLFNVFLAKTAGLEDIVVGTGVAGRRHRELEQIIGIFVNTLALRNRPEASKTFVQFLKEVKENTLEAFENQEYPFENLVEKLGVKRDTSRNPLFDVMFMLQDIEPGSRGSEDREDRSVPPAALRGPYAGSAKGRRPLDPPIARQLGTKDALEIHSHGETANMDEEEKVSGSTPEGAQVLTTQMYRVSKFDLTLFSMQIEGALHFFLEYSTVLFKADTIRQFVSYFKEIATAVVDNPGLTLRELCRMPEQRKKEMLDHFNRQLREEADGLIDGWPFSTLQETLRRSFNNARSRSAAALELDGETMSYEQLDKNSNFIANWLLENQEIEKGAFIGLLMENRVHMITAMLGILKARCVFVPMDPAYPRGRIQSMIETSGLSRMLSADGQLPEGLDLPGVAVYPWENLLADAAAAKEPRFLEEPGLTYGPDDPIYIYFTSGTTGTPRAMMGVNRCLLHFIQWETKTFDIDKTSRFSQMTTPVFDAFLRDVFVPLCNGAVISVPNRDTLRQPEALVRWVHDSKVSLIHTVPSIFRLLKDNGANGEFYPNLKYILLSGERIEPSDLDGWFRLFGERIQVVNLWGTSETTMAKTAYFVQPTDIRRHRVPVGHPIPGARVLALDENMEYCDSLEIGELYIKTPFRTAGYYNDSSANRERFIEDPNEPADNLNSSSKIGKSQWERKYQASQFPQSRAIGGAGGAAPCRSPRRGPRRAAGDKCWIKENSLLHKTGDLGRIYPDGKVDVLGRNDRQVKIRGIRVELEGIESIIMTHPGVKEAAVLKKEIGDDNELLVGYITVNETVAQQLEKEELNAFLAENMPDYMAPGKLVFLDVLPRKGSGKIDFAALPEPTEVEEPAGRGPADEVETKILAQWADVLHLEPETINVTATIFELGGHSLNIMTIISRLHREFDIRLTLADVFKNPTIEKQAALIRESRKKEFLTIERVEPRPHYPLSSAQERLFILQQMEEGGTSYNMPQVYILEGQIDENRVEEVFRLLSRRHESLRTSFDIIDEIPVQRISEEAVITVQFETLENTFPSGAEGENLLPPEPEMARIISSFIRPFNLAVAPLARVKMVRLGDAFYLVLLDMHHIISDGTSQAVFIRDFMALYAGKEPDELTIQYKDYAAWQKSDEQQERVREQEAFWLERFSGEIPVLQLPYDFPRPPLQDFSGNALTFQVEDEAVARLKKLAVDEDVTLYMMLLGLLNVVLSKLSGQEDIVVGSPTAGRRHTELEPLIGMFINTVAMRNFPEGNKLFYQYLQEIKTATLDAFENQEYQFEDLVEKVSVGRDTSRNPLFDVSFALQNMETAEMDIAGVTLKPYGTPHPISKFDLTLVAMEGDDRLICAVEYATALFKEETICRFIDYYQQAVSYVLEHSTLDFPLSALELMRDDERRRMLEEWNHTATTYPADKTLHHLFQEQVERRPHNTALVFGDCRLNYRQLDRRARNLAARLQKQGVGPNTIVGILAERSLEMIVAIWAILKAGGAYLPIDPRFPAERARYMLTDSCAPLLLTCRAMEKQGKRPFADNEKNDEKETASVIYIEEEWEQNMPYALPATRSTDLCYVIYTSGTTGKPKGTLISHANVTRMVMETNYLDILPTDRFLQLANYAFDGSVFDFFGSLLNGACLVLVKETEAADVEALGKLIKKENITVFFVTTALFNTLVDLDVENLATVRCILFGGERVSVDHCRRALKALGKGKLLHMYGPTETTVYATYYPIHHIPPSVSTIPIGFPLSNTSIYIVDKQFNPVPLLGIGEILIGGPGLSCGYLNNPQLTAEKFISTSSLPFTLTSPLPLSPSSLYRSGDLARWLPDGSIQFIGRVDLQVKIRGFRIELGEIENRVLAVPGIRECFVTAPPSPGGDRSLCAYVVVRDKEDSSLSSQALKERLATQLPDFMIPSHFIQMDALPLTTSGKVDRNRLPEPITDSEDQFTAPRNETERRLAKIWSGILGIETNEIGIDSNFFTLGGHSLKATLCCARIHKVFEIRVPLAELFSRQTIRLLADYIQESGEGARETYQALEKAEEKEFYPLSAAQKRLYIIQQMDLQSVQYNMPNIIQPDEALDIQRLETAFNLLIQRHESLRSSFHVVDEEPKQRVHEAVHFAIVARNIPIEDDMEAFLQDFIRPFDLTRAPLLRVVLATQDNGLQILAVDMHHIISDGVSHGILDREFRQLYNGEALAPLTLQYKDYAVWQRSQSYRLAKEAQEAFWVRRFDGELPVLDLPTDFPRPKVKMDKGATVTFQLDEVVTNALNRLCRQTDTTLYMVLTALLNILLSKLSGLEDIILGTPIAARRHADLQDIIGMFVNTLAIRNQPGAHKTLAQFLQEVKTATLQAFENQEYQFDDLVETIGGIRDTSRNPIFDVMFNLLNQADYAEAVVPPAALRGDQGAAPPGPPIALRAVGSDLQEGTETVEEVEIFQHVKGTSKFDMNFTAVDLGSWVQMSLEYSTALFKPETIERFIGYFKRILKVLTIDETFENVLELPLTEISILSQEEKENLWEMSNGVGDSVDHIDNEETIHRLFETRADVEPDAIAIKGWWLGENQGSQQDDRLTYHELNLVANRLANNLRTKGVGPGVIVGVMADRSFEMIIAMLATLKAGGAYLPIDPQYPKQRIRYMLTDSQLSLLLVNGETSITSETVEVVDLRDPANYSNKTANPEPFPGGNRAADLLYVIYTSGSTGTPKGVMLEHGNLVNLIHYQNRFTDISFRSVLQFTTICFDVSFQEIFSTLIAGGCLHLIDDQTRANIPALLETVQEQQMETLFLPASYLKYIMAEESYLENFPNCVSHIVTAGEQVVVTRAFAHLLREKEIRLHNHYGPSESHVVTALTLDPAKEIPQLPPIGKPVSNTAVYILDRAMGLQLPGVPGELCISGIQVGRGYLNNPTLTTEKFIPSPPSLPLPPLFPLPPSPPSPPLLPSPFSLYKTGDLARWLPDGNLEFLGRIDYQVKIRGFRVELGEIENRLLDYPGIKDTVVFARAEENGVNYLCAYVVASEAETVTTSQLRDYLGENLPDYMVPAYFVFMETIPLTANGKVNRRALPEPQKEAGQVVDAPTDHVEAKLVGMWAQLLQMDKTAVGTRDNFFQLGGHSLKATILKTRIHKFFNVEIPLAHIFQHPTIAGLAAIIRDSGASGFQAIQPVEKRDYYPLASAQKRLYILSQLNPSGTVYNMPQTFPLDDDYSPERVLSAFHALAARHESLRTTFHMIGKLPVQRIAREIDLQIQYFQLDKENPTVVDVMARFVQPFDLSQAPLFRIAVLQTAPGSRYLLVDLHHIITDGLSNQVLIDEFSALYSGSELPPLRLQYRDYALWQSGRRDSDSAIKEQENFWLKEFPTIEAVPQLNLTTDYPRPETRQAHGASLPFLLEPALSQKLKNLALAEEASDFMVMLAVTHTLFHKLTGQEDIVMGTPTAGRSHADLEPIIGMFVNTLALRARPCSNKSFRQVVQEVKSTALAAFENQDYQFDDLVDRIIPKVDPARNPIFDVMFSFENIDAPAQASQQSSNGSEQPEAIDVGDVHAKFDLQFRVNEVGGRFEIFFGYSTDLFKKETIKRYSTYFREIATAVAENNDVLLKDITISHKFQKQKARKKKVAFNI